MIVFKERVTHDFINKASDVANRLNIPLNWLMAVIELETAGTFSPAITNSLGYTGLIQFGKSTAIDLGTTTDELRAMTAIEQLEFVYDYYRPYKSKLNAYKDLYIATLFPAAVGKDRDYVLQTSRLSAATVARANPYFDLNKDGQIKVGEIEDKILDRVPVEFHEQFKKKIL